MEKRGKRDNAEGGEDPGQHVVEHHARRAAARVDPADRAGLPDVEEAKEKEGRDPAGPERRERHAGMCCTDGDGQEGDPLADKLVDDAFGRIVMGAAPRLLRGGPEAEAAAGHGGPQKQDRAGEKMHPPGARQGEGRGPGAGGGAQMAQPDHGGDGVAQPHRGTNVTAACAAMPSSRPVKPSLSEVVALTETRSGAKPVMSAMASRMACAWGVIFGASQIRVTSILLILKPFSFASSTAWARKTWLFAPFHCGSEGGKCRPISPSAKAP